MLLSFLLEGWPLNDFCLPPSQGGPCIITIPFAVSIRANRIYPILVDGRSVQFLACHVFRFLDTRPEVLENFVFRKRRLWSNHGIDGIDASSVFLIANSGLQFVSHSRKEFNTFPGCFVLHLCYELGSRIWLRIFVVFRPHFGVASSCKSAELLQFRWDRKDFLGNSVRVVPHILVSPRALECAMPGVLERRFGQTARSATLSAMRGGWKQVPIFRSFRVFKFFLFPDDFFVMASIS